MTTRERTSYFVSLGIFTSLVIIMTLMARIPMPQIKGYINLGDSMILLGTLFFGGPFGFLIGSFGSALADIIGGFPNFAIFTFVIKGVEALVFWVLIKGARKRTLPRLITAASFATIWMIGGYFWVEFFMFGPVAAYVEIPGNIMQALGSVAISVSLYKILAPKIRMKHIDSR